MNDKDYLLRLLRYISYYGLYRLGMRIIVNGLIALFFVACFIVAVVKAP